MIIRLLMTKNSHRFFLVGLFLHGDSKIPHAITFIVRKIGESGRCIAASCLVGVPDGINDGLTKELSTTKLYVFGDSIVDNGAKKSLVSGYGPYGIECFWYGKWRFTNGLTIPEMTVVELKLKVPVSFDYMEYFSNHDGVNYASGSAGILPETGSKLGKNYNMGKQVGFFKETLERYVSKKPSGHVVQTMDQDYANNETPRLVPNNQKQFYCTEALYPPPSMRSAPPHESIEKPTGDGCEDTES
ncbi:hypothetical protein Vadar_020940 [Vaccinium darrowii]|uniref:Uncharacterized protein n=1 Tax=Vaccinium darrowii TaxID=229202 RepID=A0ACB7XJB8_9ERIC|nr:hypothetical protein Vadar_020940 [Vaccinium darrowii]